MPINFRFNRTPPNNAGPAKVPERAPQLPALKLDPANPHGLQQSEGGRRTSIDRPNPDMAHFFNQQKPPAAFDNNAPVKDPIEAFYWKGQNREMGKIWGQEKKALVPKRPSAMEMHRIMENGPDNHSPMLESTINSLPKGSRDFFNGTHAWTADSLRAEMKPRHRETFGNFRFGGDAPPPQMRTPDSTSSRHDVPRPIAPELPPPPRPPLQPLPSLNSGKAFETIIIPDLTA